jgi:hypothetical protein
MSVALAVLSHSSPPLAVRRWRIRRVLYALYLAAVVIGLDAGHLVTSALLGAAVVTQILVRRRVQPAAIPIPVGPAEPER